MKFLVMSVTAGEGHNSTAKAIQAALDQRDAECVILDTLRYISPELATFISEGYLLVTEKAKYAFKIGYQMAENRRSDTFASSVLKQALSDELVDYIKSEGFDAIVFTHPFAGALLDVMKEKHMIRCPTVGILTDFTFHPFWEECLHNDYVVTPDRLLLPQARRKGFRDEQILPFGIPINPKFSRSVPTEEARRSLGLAADVPVILLMGGSMGYGHIADTVARIDACDPGTNFQMVVVCGSNADMKAEVDRYAASARHPIRVTGFVDYVSTLMDAADFIVTKPGGLTTSESLAKSLPMIIVNPIPGQEERNTEFLLNLGCAMATSKTAPIDECIYQLLESDARRAGMRTCISAIAKPDSTARLTDFLVDLAHTPVMDLED